MDRVLKESDMGFVSELKLFGVVIKKREVAKLIRFYLEEDGQYYHVMTFSEFWLADLIDLLKRL